MDTLPIDPRTGQPYCQGGTSGLAIASFVCGMVGMFGCCCCPFLLASVGAIVCGHIALPQIAANPMRGGRGLAITGLILGYIVIALFALQMVIGLLSPEFKTQMDKFQTEFRQTIDKVKEDAEKQKQNADPGETKEEPGASETK